MRVTEVRVKLASYPVGNERIQAFCSVTLDAVLVIRDVKIIAGVKGVFLAFPDRKLADHCRFCHTKNHLRARFCNECGGRLDENRAELDENGREKLHANITFPTVTALREEITREVLAAYSLALSEQEVSPGAGVSARKAVAV